MKFFKLIKYNYDSLKGIFAFKKQNFICQINNYTKLGNFSGFNIYFFKNGKRHNSKNIASFNIIYFNSKYIYLADFYYKGIHYGDSNIFDKQSWRKFVRKIKLQAFL